MSPTYGRHWCRVQNFPVALDKHFKKGYNIELGKNCRVRGLSSDLPITVVKDVR